MLITHALHSPFDYDRPNYTVYRQYREAVSYRHSKCRTPRPTPHRERGGRSGGKRARHFRKRQSAISRVMSDRRGPLSALSVNLILLKTTKSSISALGHIKTEDKSLFRISPDQASPSLSYPFTRHFVMSCSYF